MVGAVGEMASMKRRKLWKTGEDGLCCSSSAIQTQLGPSSLLEERSETPIVFVVSFVLSAMIMTIQDGSQTWYHNIENQLQNDSVINLDELPNDSPILRPMEIEENLKHNKSNQCQQSIWPKFNSSLSAEISTKSYN